MPCRSESASLPVAIWYWSLLPDQRRHRVRRRAVHPDLAVPVERHEPPGRVDERVDHGQVEAVPVGDLAPVADRRAAERVGADPDPGLLDLRQVDDVRQVVDVGAEEVVRRRRRPGPARTAPAARPSSAGLDVGVRGVGDPLRGVGVGRPAVGRVVLEAAVGGRVVRRGHDDAVGQPAGRVLAAVGAQDRVRHRRGRRVAVAVVDEHGHVVGGEHLQRGGPGRLRERRGCRVRRTAGRRTPVRLR